MPSTALRLLFTVIFVALTSSCGGGGGSANPPNTSTTGYHIGGSVSGLTGSGLVLQVNSTAVLGISINGSFTFNTTFAEGDVYSVSIQAQPSGQACAVSNGVGSISASDVSDITVVCSTAQGTWSGAEVIDSSDAPYLDEARIDVDESGNAIAIWLQDDGTSEKLVSNRYLDGTGWGVVTTISDPGNDNDVLVPQVAVDDAGNAIAVWRQHDGTRYSIWANRYQIGSGWLTPKLLESNDVNDGDVPQLAFNRSTGYAIVVWRQGEVGVSGRFVWANHYSPVTSWSGPERLEDHSTPFIERPQIAMSDQGNAVAVWENQDGEIRANILVPGVGWLGPEAIGGSTVNGANVQVAMDPIGNAIAVWEDEVGSGVVGIRSNYYFAGSGWGTDQTVEMQSSSSAYAPRVAMDATGNAIAVWHQTINSGFYRVYANHLSYGGNWASSQLISQDDIQHDVKAPDLAVDDAGDAFVVFHNTVSIYDDVYAARYQAGLGWLAPETLDSEDGQARYYPKVAVNGNGDAIAIWSQRIDSTYPFDIWVNHFH